MARGSACRLEFAPDPRRGETTRCKAPRKQQRRSPQVHSLTVSPAAHLPRTRANPAKHKAAHGTLRDPEQPLPRGREELSLRSAGTCPSRRFLARQPTTRLQQPGLQPPPVSLQPSRPMGVQASAKAVEHHSPWAQPQLFMLSAPPPQAPSCRSQSARARPRPRLAAPRLPA
jgi:hypothetical protein